jgi:alpha-ribazole phosphatase
MSEILFIRHAETDMAGTFCGHSDPELNDRGYGQLSALIERLRGRNIDAVFTSDLRRAHTSAHAIATAFHVSYHICPALREISFGEWEGLTWDEIERRDQAYADRWLAEYPNLAAPSGERLRDFEERVLNAVDRLIEQSDDHNIIAVVTHAGVIRTVLRKLQGYSEEESCEQAKEYCSVVRYNSATSLPLHCHEVNP